MSLQGRRNTRVAMGPAIVLFNAASPAEPLDMEGLGTPVITQVREADVLDEAGRFPEDGRHQHSLGLA